MDYYTFLAVLVVVVAATYGLRSYQEHDCKMRAVELKVPADEIAKVCKIDGK